MSLGYVDAFVEDAPFVISKSSQGRSLKALLGEVQKEARDPSLGSSCGEVTGIAFPRFCRDRRRLRSALAARRTQRRAPRDNAGSLSTLLGATSGYEEAAARLSPDEPARDMAQMLAWARQAGNSVHPGRHHLGERCLPFRHFVDASVVCVILLEDVGETFGGSELRDLEVSLDRVVNEFFRTPRSARWRSAPGASAKGSPEQHYLASLGASLGLLGELLDQLWRPEDRPQRGECDSWLVNAIAEVVRSRDVSRAFHRYVARNEVVSTPRAVALERHVASLDTAAFVEANRANIFMRAMFEAGIRAAVARRSPRRSAWDHDWWTLAAETRSVGAALEGLGNMANDLATFFREWGEGFAGNFLLVQGFSSGAFSPEWVRESYRELDVNFAARERRELMTELGKIYFASGPERAEAHLADAAPRCHATRALLAALCRDRVIEQGADYWHRESRALRRDLREGGLDVFFAEDALWRRQVGFLFQYLTANALV